ncbi:cytochrome c peroxidase [Noviherbaspirillum suwonense]|uniref:cytochrome c peroxidase n=1 Tax=Noviherbaspirillum suwonense TaxID=1224511 RepID=UPI003D2B65E0
MLLTDAACWHVVKKYVAARSRRRGVYADRQGQETAAIQSGKSLFWNPRVGSDNKTACATCHFNAGADNRTKLK